MKILVPYDFTAVTRTALDHAMALARLADAKIVLLHIVEEEEQRADAERNFNGLVKLMPAEDRARLSTQVEVGDIFKDITREATEGDFQLVLMGTHGERGFQRLFGSNAIKIITSGHLPFIVTQTQGPPESIERIVMPVDLTKESLQIVNFAARAAKRFDAEIDIVYEKETDEWLVKKMRINVTQVKNYLDQKKVRHRVVGLPGEDSFEEEVINYGEQNGADLFAIAHFSDSFIPQFDRFSQEMITNKLQVPVLIQNAAEVGRVEGHYTFIGM